MKKITLLCTMLCLLFVSSMRAQNTINFDDQAYTDGQVLGESFNITNNGQEFTISGDNSAIFNYATADGGTVKTTDSFSVLSIKTTDGTGVNFKGFNFIDLLSSYQGNFLQLRSYKNNVFLGVNIIHSVNNTVYYIDTQGRSEFEDADEIRLSGTYTSGITIDNIVWKSNVELELTSDTNCGLALTSYQDSTNSYNTEDPIFLFNTTTESRLTCPTGTNAAVYDWYVFNPTANAYEAYALNSTNQQDGLADGGYLVVRTDGAERKEGRAWVWSSSLSADIGSDATVCEGDISLDGSNTNLSPEFVYYDPALAPIIIDENTTISVDLTGTHTYVSDLGFYLVTPSGDAITLNSPILGYACNSSNNFTNLVFTTASTDVFDMCNYPTTILTGSYGIYTDQTDFNNPQQISIDWSPAYGSNANANGWKVQIFDCVDADIGTLTQAKITFNFSNNTDVVLDSGSVNIPINDNSCTPETASSFEVNYGAAVANTYSLTINDGVGIANATQSGYEWFYTTASESGPWTSFSNTTLSPNLNVTENTWVRLALNNGLGCTKDEIIAYTVNALEDASFSYSASSYCSNDPNPTPTITGVGGGTFTATPAGLNINASTGEIDKSLSTPNTYTITYSTSGSCPNSSSVTVTLSSMYSSLDMVNNVSCNGGSDGSITVAASGGTAPYTYLWSNGATTASISGLVAGEYTVIITDANGCTTQNGALLLEPTVLTASISKTDVSCNNGNDGSLAVTPTGGTAPYTYLWNTGATTATINNLYAGGYSVTITDANGCTASTSEFLENPQRILCSVLSTGASCIDINNGTITTGTVIGGTAPYTYLWSTGETTPSLDNAYPGDYWLEITDVNGCVGRIEGIPVFNGNNVITEFSYTKNNYCKNEDNTAPIFGPYTYIGGTFSSTSGLIIDSTTGVIDVSGSTPGEYVVTYAVGGACSSSTTQTITINAVGDASFAFATSSYYTTDSNPTPTIATPGGIFTATPAGLSINETTGVIDISGSSPNTYSITYTTPEPCSNNSQIDITIINAVDATHLNLDGVDDYVALPEGIVSSATDFTFEAMVNYTDNGVWERVFDFGNSTTEYMFLTLDPSTNQTFPRFGITTVGGESNEEKINSTTAVPTGWFHIAVTIKGSVGTMYINGEQVGQNTSMTLNPSSLGSTTNNYLGKSQYNDPYFKGDLDEVRIWSTARSQAEIQAYKDTELQGDETGLVAYYNFNQGISEADNTAITSLTDNTNNSNDGTLTDFTLNGATSNWLEGSVITSGESNPKPYIINVTSSANDGTYGLDDTITINIEFSEDVTVNGSPILTLETGDTDRQTSYVMGYAGAIHMFNYTVQQDDTSADLSYISTSALTLNGSTMKDAFGVHDAILLLPTPGATGSLSFNKDIVIDSTLSTTSFMLSQVSLYPNPVQDILTVNLPNTSTLKSIIVNDITGKKVQYSTTTSVDMSNVNAGLYLVTINTTQGVITKKVVKQ